MKTATIYRKTMAYVWLKSLLCLLSVAVAVLLYLLLYKGLSAIGEGPGATGFILWIMITPFIYPLIRYFFGHRIEAGHLNAINEAISTERLPIALLSTMDKEAYEQFPYFSMYKEVEITASSSVKQLYERIDASADLFHGVASKEWYIRFVKKSINTYLYYISTACVGQIFAKPAQKQERTLAQSIAVFFRNWQSFLLNAYTTTSRMIIGLAVTWVILTALGIALSITVSGASIMTVCLGIGVGYILTDGIKTAFADPVHIINMMKVFAEVSLADKEDPETYGKMALLSPAFAKLWKKLDGFIPNAEETSIVIDDDNSL